MKSVKDTEVSGKKVFLRGDLDAPIKNGQVADDFRLQKMLPTINYLIKNKAKVILAGHLDRPGGKIVEELKMDPLRQWFKDRADVEILENLRFNSGEEKNDPEFAKELAALAEIYVNDCFSTSHRRHASIVGVPKHLPSFAGLHLVEETETLRKVRESAKRPLVFIIGGGKAETKIPLVKKISRLADKILLGGSLMFAKSLEEAPKVRFPVDAVRIDDIGPKTIEMFKNSLDDAGTVVWNGPLGVTEAEEFEVGTREIAQTLAKSPAYTVVGGGDTIAALNRFGLRDKMNFVSTGGGAMLEFLAEGTLPGLEVLGWKKV